jgi:hypothetical protein
MNIERTPFTMITAPSAMLPVTMKPIPVAIAARPPQKVFVLVI